jgi:hypothetical protein
MGGIATRWAGGGGGFQGNGADGTDSGKGGNSFINGGARQTSGTNGNYAYGGFGGGASNHGFSGNGAGGGGYTGGGASLNNSCQGGGGGSYFEGYYNKEASIAISRCNPSLPTNPDTNGNGYASLTLLTGTSSIVNNYISCSYYRIPITWTLYVVLTSQ